MSFWGLLLALVSWGVIAVLVWAPLWAKLLLVGMAIGIGLLCVLEHARRPPLVGGVERKR